MGSQFLAMATVRVAGSMVMTALPSWRVSAVRVAVWLPVLRGCTAISASASRIISRSRSKSSRQAAFAVAAYRLVAEYHCPCCPCPRRFLSAGPRGGPAGGLIGERQVGLQPVARRVADNLGGFDAGADGHAGDQGGGAAFGS